MSLALGFIVLVIFLCSLIFYAVLILRDFSKMTDEIEQIVTRVHKTVVEPLRAIDFLVERARPYIEMALEKREKASKAKKNKED